MNDLAEGKLPPWETSDGQAFNCYLISETGLYKKHWHCDCVLISLLPNIYDTFTKPSEPLKDHCTNNSWFTPYRR